jgi:hemin uptake protein HemP
MNPSFSLVSAGAAPPRERPAAAPASAGLRRAACARLSSAAILSGAQEVEIDHQGAIYRLRITSLGKLILTK